MHTVKSDNIYLSAAQIAEHSSATMCNGGEQSTWCFPPPSCALDGVKVPTLP